MPLPKGYQWSNTAIRMQSNGYVEPSREEIETDKEDYKASEQMFSEWDWQNEQGLGPQGQALPNGALGWKPDGQADYGTGLTGWWNKVSNKVKDAWNTGYEEGLQISGITKFAVEKLNPVDSKNNPEQAAKTLEAMKEARKPENEAQAKFAATAEATKEVFNQALWGLLDGLSKPAVWAEQALGSTAYAIADTIQGKDINWSRNWEASRLLYSGLFDATVFTEMERRLDSGMRGDLAAMEVMIQKPNTMWPELIGQLALDPLNALTVFTKAGQQVRIAKNVKKTFHEVTNPAVLKMLDDISNLDDAAAYQRIDDIVKTQQGLTTAAEHADDIAKAGKDIEALSTSYKMSSLTRDGKVAHLANQSGEILMHVVNNSSPDEALEIIRGMVKSTSKNADEAAEGISAMLHFADPKALFSEAGNKTTVMLSRMSEKYGATWLDNIAKLKDDPVNLTKDLLGKLDEVGEEMFPSVSKMLEAEDLVKAGDKTEKNLALADRAAKLPAYVKSATRFHDTAQKVVGPINRFFIGAYMGWSPGFAFRNFSNNSLQLLIDYGPGVLLGNADNMFAKAEKLHGGILQGAFSEGGQAAALFPDVAKVGAQARNTGVSAIIDAAKQKGLKGPVLGMSQTLEANAAKRIIAKTYTKTFEQGTKAMVKSMTADLKAAGFSDDIIKKLPTYITQNDGDAAKVITALRDEVATGTIDLFNDISRIDPKYKSFLSDTGKWDEYAENVLRAPTREAAQSAAQKIFDDIAQAGDYVYREARPAVGVDDQFLKMASERAGMPETRGQLVSIRTTENRKAIEAAEAILKEADDLGAQLGLNVGSLKKARGINEISGWGADAAKEATRIRELAWKATNESRKSTANLTQLWGMFSPDPMPAVRDVKEFRNALWAKFDEVMSLNWGGARDTAVDNVGKYLDDLKAAGAEIPDQWYDTIKQAQEGAAQYDNAMVGRFGELVEETPMAYGTRSTQIRTIAQKSGMATATEAGAPMDSKVLRTINKYAETTYKSLEEVPLSVAEEAFAKKAGKAAGEITEPIPDFMRGKSIQEWDEDIARIEADIARVKESPEQFADAQAHLEAYQGDLKKYKTWRETASGDVHFDDAGNLVEPARKRILPPPTDGELPPVSRAIHEQMEEVTKMRKWVMDDIGKNFGKKQVTDRLTEGALQKAQKELAQKLAENKLISSRVAQANRDFTLLNYGDKSYWDVALSYLYPFHYWYKGTYKNWLTRIAANPAVLGHYSRYKQILGTVHAGMPEWWKYNINSNDLPGVDVENPLYFNLEATLWPLNGITGMDFNDRSKVTDWWTHSLDFANKFGPSTWTPLSMMTGLALYNKGEQEAGLKWMGRVFPQSATIKAVASKFGIGNLETDPIVKYLGGGLDPYEKRRVSRALAAMEQEALRGELPYSQEQIQDAAYAQEGDIWDEAVKRAVNGRSGSQISSFLFGVGFKGRTNEDKEVDQFYTDYGKLWTMRPNLSQEEFREGMDQLKTKYPFMDTMLLSSRDAEERDAGLAYNVLTRIPPGQSSDIAKAVGIDNALLDKFFATKGQLEDWNAADRSKFMAGVLTMAAVLEIPDDMTRGEWTQAKNAYSGLTAQAKSKFGEDILDQVDGYYAAKTKGPDQGTAYLDEHPDVSQYMDWKAQRVMQSPLLSAYYGGVSQIEGYYRSQQYKAIENELGEEIFDIIDEYNALKTFGESGEAKSFYNQNKAAIRKYYSLKDDWAVIINQQTARLAAQLPEGQGAGIREDVDVTSPSAQNLVNSLQPEEQPTLQDFEAAIPQNTMSLIYDYYTQGERLPESAQKQLDRIAREMGYEYSDDLLQAVGIAMYETQQP